MAARFGDMLLEQRRRMGLSIQQVANTIKIRPQIIEFFETGNFASMPPRGYAQGMISSYARFLGLNPREVVNAYFDDLMAYERETSQQGGRFQDAAGYVNSRSSVDNGRFLMVQGGRSTRYGQRPQQAGYITETGSSEEIRSQRDRFRSTPMPDDRALPAARGVVRDPRVGYGDGGYSDRGYRGVSAGRALGGYADADATQVTPRLRSQSQPYGQRSSAPRAGQRGYQGRGELAPRSGQRSLQGQGGVIAEDGNGVGTILVLGDGIAVGLEIVQVGHMFTLAIGIPTGVQPIQEPAVDLVAAVVQHPVVAHLGEGQGAVLASQVNIIASQSSVVVVQLGTGFHNGLALVVQAAAVSRGGVVHHGSTGFHSDLAPVVQAAAILLGSIVLQHSTVLEDDDAAIVANAASNIRSIVIHGSVHQLQHGRVVHIIKEDAAAE